MQLTWQSTPPRLPGWYWCCTTDGLLSVCQVAEQPFDGKEFKRGDLIVRDGAYVGGIKNWVPFWMGPIDAPSLPGEDDDIDCPSGSVPSVAGVGGRIFDNDDDDD